MGREWLGGSLSPAHALWVRAPALPPSALRAQGPPSHRDKVLGVAPWTIDTPTKGTVKPHQGRGGSHSLNAAWVLPAPRCSRASPSPGLGTWHWSLLPDCPSLPWPALPWPGHGQQVGDSALLPQDLICVLIDDGGFLVLSNQEDHWYQVSSDRKAALLAVGCQQEAETFELMSQVG